MARQRKPLMARLEVLGLAALHGFPVLYCRSNLLKPGTPATFLFDTYRDGLVTRLAVMPFWQRIFVVYIWPPAMVVIALTQTAANGWFIA